MVILSAAALALKAYLAYLCAVLLYRFLKIRSKLPAMELRGGLSRRTGRKLAVCGALFFFTCFAGQMGPALYSPDMLMVFNYEEAARGQNPNVTRFNESDILSDHILEEVIRRGDLKISVDRLADFLTISAPLDAEKLDVSVESNLKISTEYRVRCSGKVSLYRTSPRTVLSLLADAYWEYFVSSYGENDSVLDLSFEGLEGMEYLDVKDYLSMQANKLRNYIPVYSNESSSFRETDSQETFASLSQKISNFIDIDLERYEAFVLENGLSQNSRTYQSRMQYANRLLDTSQRKELAAYDVRIEAIQMYDAFMTRFVLIPTYDEEKEFYMSRTKVGVDYFADEAKEHLATATVQGEEIEHNAYASEQIRTSKAGTAAYDQAARYIEEMKAEHQNLSVQCRELCGAYFREKRAGYIQVGFTAPSAAGEAVKAFALAAAFAAAQAGFAVSEPVYRELRENHAGRGSGKAGEGKEERKENGAK